MSHKLAVLVFAIFIKQHFVYFQISSLCYIQVKEYLSGYGCVIFSFSLCYYQMLVCFFFTPTVLIFSYFKYSPISFCSYLFILRRQASLEFAIPIQLMQETITCTQLDKVG